MRLTMRLSAAASGLSVLLLLAVAGVTHGTTLLALPWRSHRDAFSRIAGLAPVATKVVLHDNDPAHDPLPYRDPAFVTALCRYDLRTQPFRLSLTPFESGFVTIGFHSRHGLAFYGLTVRAVDAPQLDLVVAMKDAGSTDLTQHAVTVMAPEPEGFVLLATPAGDGLDRSDALNRLAAFACHADTAAP